MSTLFSGITKTVFLGKIHQVGKTPLWWIHLGVSTPELFVTIKFFCKPVLCLFKVHQEMDSLVYSSQGIWDSSMYLLPGSWDSPVYSLVGSWDSLMYSSPGSHFGH
jgi:hypothetical protein